MEKVDTYIPAAQYKAVEHSVYNRIHNSHFMRINNQLGSMTHNNNINSLVS